MSKRRRDRTPNLPPETFTAPIASAAPKVATEAATAQTAILTARKATVLGVDWKAEYGEVLGDLRRTFLIFGLLVVGMIALSFVIR
jgi:hypothetical protein